MALATLAFFACAFPLNFAWFFAWRFASGLAGGALMVLAAPTVLPSISPSRRGLAGGAIFMGVGAGIVASGTLVPLLLQLDVSAAWFGLGALSLLLMVIGWSGWPSAPPASAPARHRAKASPAGAALALCCVRPQRGRLAASHDLPGRLRGAGHGQRRGGGLKSSGWCWDRRDNRAAGGGRLADHIGFWPTLRLAFLLEAGAIAIPAFGLGWVWLILSSVIVGSFLTGTIPWSSAGSASSSRNISNSKGGLELRHRGLRVDAGCRCLRPLFRLRAQWRRLSATVPDRFGSDDRGLGARSRDCGDGQKAGPSVATAIAGSRT